MKRKGFNHFYFICIVIIILFNTSLSQISDLAKIGPDGKLVYKSYSSKGDILPDFSWCGYRYGEKVVPEVAAVKTISPVSGDNLAHIQAAIDEVSAMPLNSDGIRGALLLKKGAYEVSNTLYIRAGGVIIRGEGSGENDTRLIATRTEQHTLLQVDGPGGPSEQSNTTVDITDSYVPVGARTFTVESSHTFNVGDRVMVRHMTNDAWIQILGMDKLSQTDPDDTDWEATSYRQKYKRRIMAVSGSSITLDAPVVDCIADEWGGGIVYKYTWDSRIENVGIEDIRLLSEYSSDDDEEHGWHAVGMNKVEHGWMNNVVAYYFGYSCANLGRDAKNITIDNCQMVDPKSQTTGGRKYSFNILGQLTLVKDCYTWGGRHDYVTGSQVPGPNVFVDCESKNQKSAIGPHHRWANGLLFDNIVGTRDMEAHNRLNSGTGHGWAGANTIYWNCKASYYNIESPRPVAENFAIGCIGDHRKNGYFESKGIPVTPRSLYYKQLEDRLDSSTAITPSPENQASYIGIHIESNCLLRITAPSAGAYILAVLTISGRKVMEKSFVAAKDNTTLQIVHDRELPAGMYIISLKSRGMNFRDRFFVIR